VTRSKEERHDHEKITMSLAALALGGGLTVGTAFARHAGARSMNDNGIPTGRSFQSTQPAQSGAPYDQPSGYDRPGGVYSGVYNEAPGMGPGDQSADESCEARFRSHNAASATYLGYDGMRHPCP
jgi:hypothetical protein